MATTKKRIMVPLSKDAEKALSLIAKESGSSQASVASRLIDDALELEEDFALSKLADERLSQKNIRYLSHEEVWGKLSQ